MKERRQRKRAHVRFSTLTPVLDVRDIEASLAWYRDIVGCFVGEEMRHEDRLVGAVLKTGSVEIHLRPAAAESGSGAEEAAGSGVSLNFVTRQDLDEMARGIENAGGELASVPADQPWGGRAFSLVDPDGYVLVIAADEG